MKGEWVDMPLFAVSINGILCGALVGVITVFIACLLYTSNSMFFSYLEYRKEKGKEVKGKAIGYCIDKLESLSNSPVEQVAIIKQTIQNLSLIHI